MDIYRADKMREEDRRAIQFIMERQFPHLLLKPEPEPETEAAPLPEPDDCPSTNFADITAWVSKKHGVTTEAMRGGSRSKPVSRARQEAFYLCRRRLGASYQRIGNYYGDRDHTTALYGAREHAKRNGLPMPDDAPGNTGRMT